VTLLVGIAGTATFNVDYTLSPSSPTNNIEITVPAGSTSASVILTSALSHASDKLASLYVNGATHAQVVGVTYFGLTLYQVVTSQSSSPSSTPTLSLVASASASNSFSSSETLSASITATASASRTSTRSGTPSRSASHVLNGTPSRSPTKSVTRSRTPTNTPTDYVTVSVLPSSQNVAPGASITFTATINVAVTVPVVVTLSLAGNAVRCTTANQPTCDYTTDPFTGSTITVSPGATTGSITVTASSTLITASPAITVYVLYASHATVAGSTNWNVYLS